MKEPYLGSKIFFFTLLPNFLYPQLDQMSASHVIPPSPIQGSSIIPSERGMEPWHNLFLFIADE